MKIESFLTFIFRISLIFWIQFLLTMPTPFDAQATLIIEFLEKGDTDVTVNVIDNSDPNNLMTVPSCGVAPNARPCVRVPTTHAGERAQLGINLPNGTLLFDPARAVLIENSVPASVTDIVRLLIHNEQNPAIPVMRISFESDVEGGSFDNMIPPANFPFGIPESQGPAPQELPSNKFFRGSSFANAQAVTDFPAGLTIRVLSSDVPEPTAWMLLGLGLAILGRKLGVYP
jgi:PEP-CTERM motif